MLGQQVWLFCLSYDLATRSVRLCRRLLEFISEHIQAQRRTRTHARCLSLLTQPTWPARAYQGDQEKHIIHTSLISQDCTEQVPYLSSQQIQHEKNPGEETNHADRPGTPRTGLITNHVTTQIRLSASLGVGYSVNPSCEMNHC